MVFWKTIYPDTVPVGYRLRHYYPDKWFRIHSLPDSQRYPADQADWDILLDRQNTILTDLLGNDSPILIIDGDYRMEGYEKLQPIEVESMKPFVFTKVEPSIDLNAISPEFYDKGQTCTPIFTEQVWQAHQFNDVLRDIAEWRVTAFFVSVQNHCMLAPYDGGMDLILKDSTTRDFYKEKYKAWLSPFEGGL